MTYWIELGALLVERRFYILIYFISLTINYSK